MMSFLNHIDIALSVLDLRSEANSIRNTSVNKRTN